MRFRQAFLISTIPWTIMRAASFCEKGEYVQSIRLFRKVTFGSMGGEARLQECYCLWKLGKIDEAKAVISVIEEHVVFNRYGELDRVYLRVFINVMKSVLKLPTDADYSEISNKVKNNIEKISGRLKRRLPIVF